MTAGAIVLGLTMAGVFMSNGNSMTGGFKLPASTGRTLGNGVRVHVMEFHELPLVNFQVIVGAGSAHDPRGKEGLAALVADLLRKGAGGRSARDIADAVDFVGGSLDAVTDQDASRLSAEFLAKDTDLGLDLLSDLLMRPGFAAEELDRLKGEVVGELQAARENPGLLASRRFIEILYGEHPYGHPIPGWESTVPGVTREDVVGFYKRRYTPDNVIVVAVGDFKAEDMLGRIERRLSGWQGKAARGKEVPSPAAPAGRATYLIDKPDSTQSQIRIGGIGIKRMDPDFAILTVANTILGGGFTSRLVEEIRVNRGLSYSAGSRFQPLVREGPFMINTFTKNQTTLETIQVALETLDRFRREGPTEEEVDKARRYLKGGFAIAHQAPDAMGDVLAEIAFYGLPADYYDTWLDRIAAVTVADVKRVAAARFPGDKLVLVVLGEAAAVREDLAKLGPVTSAPLAAH